MSDDKQQHPADPFLEEVHRLKREATAKATSREDYLALIRTLQDQSSAPIIPAPKDPDAGAA